MTSIPHAWPALLDLDAASAYLTLAPGSLLNLLRRESICPVVLGARLRRWRREDLDALVARLAPEGTPSRSTTLQETVDGLDHALAAVGRRSHRINSRSATPDEVRQPRPGP